MKSRILNAYSLNLHYLNELAKDIAPDEMTLQPEGIKNHAAWQIGHLVNTANGTAQLLGLESQVPENYKELFGQGSTPTNDAGRYPDKETLLSQLAQQHQRVAAAFETASEELLTQPLENENLNSVFPTNGDLIVFMLTGHEGTHAGQLSAWRRVIGKGPAIPGL